MKHYDIHVTLKKVIFDPAGQNSAYALENLGFKGVEDVRIGKFIQLTTEDSITAADVDVMCKKLLANPVIEDYTIKEA